MAKTLAFNFWQKKALSLSLFLYESVFLSFKYFDSKTKMIFPLNRETVNYNVKNKRNIMKKRISAATLTALFYLFKSIQYVNKIVLLLWINLRF